MVPMKRTRAALFILFLQVDSVKSSFLVVLVLLRELLSLRLREASAWKFHLPLVQSSLPTLPLLLCHRCRYWIRVCLKSRILVQESVDIFMSNFFTFSLICSGYWVKVINLLKFPCVIAINVRRPSSRRFCIPLVSSTSGPFIKFSAPNVTKSPRITTIDNPVTAWSNSRIR